MEKLLIVQYFTFYESLASLASHPNYQAPTSKLQAAYFWQYFPIKPFAFSLPSSVKGPTALVSEIRVTAFCPFVDREGQDGGKEGEGNASQLQHYGVSEFSCSCDRATCDECHKYSYGYLTWYQRL